MVSFDNYLVTMRLANSENSPAPLVLMRQLRQRLRSVGSRHVDGDIILAGSACSSSSVQPPVAGRGDVVSNESNNRGATVMSVNRRDSGYDRSTGRLSRPSIAGGRRKVARHPANLPLGKIVQKDVIPEDGKGAQGLRPHHRGRDAVQDRRDHAPRAARPNSAS